MKTATNKTTKQQTNQPANQPQKKKLQLPGIGMRIIKSALAVTLCFMVNYLRGDAGMVFYSQLAALWCIQMYRNKTFANAMQRTIGTIIGALYGLIYILSYPRLIVMVPYAMAMKMFCIFVGIILVIYTSVLIHKNQAAYFSCVVFLSIVINHMGDSNPYNFVWNRFLDTMIGIAIGIFVNNIRICRKPDRETLFVSGVDDILVDHHNHVSAFSKVELNRMIDDGLRFTLSTMRTPASLLEPLSEINLKYPVIVMDGAALYDVKKSAYVREYVISKEMSNELIGLMEKEGLCYYTNVIIDDTLLIYYQQTEDAVNRDMVATLRTSPFRNYINRKFPGDEAVVYLMLLDKDVRIHDFYQKLVALGYTQRLKVVAYPSDDYPGYSYIKIYNNNASKENMLLYLRQTYDIKETMTIGTVAGKYDMLVKEDSFNEMVRMVRERYEPFLGIHKKKKE